MVIISFLFPVATRFDTEDSFPSSWLGEWTVCWKNTLGEQFVGSSRLSQPQENTLLREELQASQAGAWRGWKGLTMAKFNARSQTWHYAWQDNRGSYCDFIGQFKGKIFSLQFVDARGERIRQRMVVQSIKSKAIAWDCQKYETKTGVWRKVWNIEYRRR